MSAPVELNAAEVCAALGIVPDEYRVQWARTITLNAGTVRIAIDLDMRNLTEDDQAMLVGLGEILRALSALQPERGA